MWFRNRSDTNQAVQSQKQARSLKFWIYEEEELYYLCRENKGSDQLRSYCKADLRFYFLIYADSFFLSRGDSYVSHGNFKRRKL